MSDAPTPWERLRSAYHGASLLLSERSGRARRPAPPLAAGELRLEPGALARAAELATRFGVRFETILDHEAALQAYEYLNYLDELMTGAGLSHESRDVLHDVGCASFGYVSALAAALRPRSSTGFDVEGYRRLRGGINRAERALAHVAAVPGAAFRIADYRTVQEPADEVTLFFPFVTRAPVLGWRMPLSVLTPDDIFHRAAANLRSRGRLWMVNHSRQEADIAARHATGAGLVRVIMLESRSPFRSRPVDAVASLWTGPSPGRE